jgi:hypothetical protein
VSHVIEFLERLGQDSHLRHAPIDVVALALSEAGIEGPAKSAIIGADRGELEALLGARSKMYCGIFAPEEQEKEGEEQEDQEGEDEKEDESEDDEEVK